MKKKCHGCGIVDSLHQRDEGKSKLVWDWGLKDEKGLQVINIYCRSCGTLNMYIPGWIGNYKYKEHIDLNSFYQLYVDKDLPFDSLRAGISPKLQTYMVIDGILPEDWEVY